MKDFIFINDKTDIKYLEIGVFYGINFFSVLNTYCVSKHSELHAIDCWADEHYNHYDNLINKSELIYNTFLENVSISGETDKIKIHRGYSYDKIKEFDLIPLFTRNSFIIKAKIFPIVLKCNPYPCLNKKI